MGISVLRRTGRPLELEWVGFLVGLLLVVFATNRGPAARIVWESSLALFIIVVIAATLCIVASGIAFAIAWRDDTGEACILASGLLVMSVLPLVHGITAPGVLYGDNTSVMTSVYLALPIAAAAMSPLLIPSAAVRRTIGKRWRAWCVGWVTLATVVAIALLVWPNALSVPQRSNWLNIVLVVVSLVCLTALSYRQLRLFWISERPSTLVASFSMLFLGLTALVWTGDRPFSLGWWLVHVLDIAGVFAGCFALVFSHRSQTSVRELLAPVATRDPLVALELGLSPTVHRFVASLETKDRITRDHVVRVAEAAIAVGSAMGMNERQLRFLGLGALLHDIGKLNVPDAILKKPSGLTDDEYEVIKRHTLEGESMLREIPSLAQAAAFVRSHHERIDGCGYPDAKSADEIPLESRIIAVCDSFDAMRHSRQYRAGMSWERATEIIRANAGTQWDATVVETALRVLAGRPDDGAALVRVGRPTVDDALAELIAHSSESCGCDDELRPLVEAVAPSASR